MSQNPLRALRDYRDLPPAFGTGKMISAALARAPFAMLPLGIMTAFTFSTGDIAVGGLATAFFSIAVATCSPLIGRAADIWGQRRVLLTIMPINAVALLALYWAALNSPSTATIYLICLLAGLTASPIGSFTRARWVAMHPKPRTLMAAFSYESMADEFVFVLGPAFVGIAATAAAPSAPLLIAFIVLVLAGFPFALTAPTEPLDAVSGDTPGTSRPSIGKIFVAVSPAIIALISVGAFFGSSQAAVTVRAEELGSAGSAGLVYAAMGISSALMALLVVVLPDRFKLYARFITFSVAVSALTIVTSYVPSLPLTALALFVAGAFVGPTLVTAFTLAEKLTPEGGVAVAMTLMSSSVTVGVSLGAAIGGRVAESSGSHNTFLLSAGVILVAGVIGLILKLKSSALGRDQVA